MKNTSDRKKQRKAYVMAGITAGMLFPLGAPALGDGELDPTPKPPKPAPKPTPPDKAIKFFVAPPKSTGPSQATFKSHKLEIRHALGTKKADLPTAIHETDAKTAHPLKPFAAKKAGTNLPEWVNKFIASKGKP